jgi:hypothetical protein
MFRFLFIFYIVIVCIFVRSVMFSQKSILLAVAVFLKYKWASFVWDLFLSHCRASILFKWRFSTLFTKLRYLFTRVALHLHRKECRSILISWCYLCVCTSTTIITVIALTTTCIFSESALQNLIRIALYHHHHPHHHHHHHLSKTELGHLLTCYGLTLLEVSLMVCPGFFLPFGL